MASESMEFLGTIVYCDADKIEGPWAVTVALGNGRDAMRVQFFNQKLPLGTKPLATGQKARVVMTPGTNEWKATFERDDKASFPVEPAMAAAGDRR